MSSPRVSPVFAIRLLLEEGQTRKEGEQEKDTKEIDTFPLSVPSFLGEEKDFCRLAGGPSQAVSWTAVYQETKPIPLGTRLDFCSYLQLSKEGPGHRDTFQSLCLQAEPVPTSHFLTPTPLLQVMGLSPEPPPSSRCALGESSPGVAVRSPEGEVWSTSRGALRPQVSADVSRDVNFLYIPFPATPPLFAVALLGSEPDRQIGYLIS